MSGYPDLRRSVTGVWPPRPYMVPRGIPILGEDMYGAAKGQGLIVGWVAPPEDDNWDPEALLWTPPGTKALDLAGEIVDVQDFGDSHRWVTAQIAKRDRYLELIRARVRAGTMKLTAALAGVLGIPFEDGVNLADTRPEPGAAAELAGLMAKHLRGVGS